MELILYSIRLHSVVKGAGHPMTFLYGHRGETEVHLQPIRILSDRRVWVMRATPWSFYTREEPGTYHAGGWLGLGAGLEGQQKPRPQRNSIPGQSTRSQSLYQLSYPGRPSIREQRQICYLFTFAISLWPRTA